MGLRANDSLHHGCGKDIDVLNECVLGERVSCLQDPKQPVLKAKDDTCTGNS